MKSIPLVLNFSSNFAKCKKMITLANMLYNKIAKQYRRTGLHVFDQRILEYLYQGRVLNGWTLYSYLQIFSVLLFQDPRYAN